jgi:hypothetical protein
VIEPGPLNLGARHGLADRFDRCDLGDADAVDRSDARTGGNAIDMHGAGAAQRHAATELRASHAQDIAQHPEEWGVAVDIDAVGVAVDAD